jgi:hypothetical protein
MRPWLDFLDEDWQPVSNVTLIGWLAFYALFLLHAATDDDGFLFIDRANLVVHGQWNQPLQQGPTPDMNRTCSVQPASRCPALRKKDDNVP